MKRTKTRSFLLELPLEVNAGQSSHLRAHFEAGRNFYNALLGEAMKRLKAMRNDPRWQKARAIPKSQKQERQRLFSEMRTEYGFSEYALHAYATSARCHWMADHLDANTAQKLATRAFQAAQRVCLGQAKKVRFKSKGRGLDSLEGKNNTTGIRFVLQGPKEGNAGWLVWGKERIATIIDWKDEVVCHGLRHRIKYVRLVRRAASSPRAKGADCEGNYYFVQLILEGKPLVKPKHQVGTDTIGLDIGPSTLAIVPREGEAHLVTFCEELASDMAQQRRLERKMDRQRRANNPENYDAEGRVKKHGKKKRLKWHNSKRYLATRRQHAKAARKVAAHRKSLHGKLAHQIVSQGNTIHIEKTSFKGWQKVYGKSVGLRAPGMFLELLRRIVANTGGILSEVPTNQTRFSQYCHGCSTYTKKPLSQRWHVCPCGVGPVQRDLYSAFLLAHLEPPDLSLSLDTEMWKGAEPRLRAAIESIQQRANAGGSFPQSMGLTRARARRLKSLGNLPQGLVAAMGQEEWACQQEPPVALARGGFSSVGL